MSPATSKIELPLNSDAEIARLVDQFEVQELPYKHWTHRAHLAVAVYYLHNHTFNETLKTIRRKINDYNRARGDPNGYNETVTIAFLAKIREQLTQPSSRISAWQDFTLAVSTCTIAWLYNHYSPELVWSDEAKARWVPPDLTDFPFPTQ
ncbi:hypothetical protein [Synechococcus sp. CS-1328]|uniref:hypothetical protein n=1 Tax=Synechococcus sp. CS-1328 TaxID=2847976 RepID=UPI00223B2E1B|nr:hypothetical protein [Synechococcus sp. CS-1328]MCT0224894.1 hypothetical protein [Synechococcus sp. CS-1328]